MRIMLDTNVLVSIVLSSKKMNQLFLDICEKHTLVLCPYILEETRQVVTDKFPERRRILERIFSNESYEVVENTTTCKQKVNIRDPKDVPIIVGAINGQVELLITGDKDFDNVEIPNIKIIKPSEY